jgi:uncharacterized protein (TIGR03083 family)
MDREAVLAVARAERNALGRTVQYAEPSRWDDPSACAGWRNRDVVGHLAAGDAHAAAAIAGETYAELAEGADGEEFNQRTVAKRADVWSSRQLRAGWEYLLRRAAQIE